MKTKEIALLTDSYKQAHWPQYPEGTEYVFSYFESRSKSKNIVYFGSQAIIKEYLVGQVVTAEGIDKAEAIISAHMGPNIFNREGWEYILNEHDGRLPVEIRTVAEGTVVPSGNVLMTVENTDPKCYWLTNFLETLLVQTWYPTTVATRSREIMQLIAKYAEKNGTVDDGLKFKLHDFGFRGVSSVESAAIGGMAHLVNFMGTDTIPALIAAQEYYDAEMAGFSIPASEHSTITSWGRDGEIDAFRNMLNQYPTGLVACVSDSYDIYAACSEKWGTELKDQIMNRDGTLVVRPDSGEPALIVRQILEILGEKFGYTVNEKGYKVLPPQIRIIQGDGMSKHSIESVLFHMDLDEWSVDNIAFGMGGGLLQDLNRDDYKFAFKCSSVVVNGEERDVYKEPITAAWKTSKKGRLMLCREGNEYATRPQTAWDVDELQTVFRNGEMVTTSTFDEVRERASLPVNQTVNA